MDCNDLKVDLGFFIMLNPFMILSKQSGVLLTHFWWGLFKYLVTQNVKLDRSILGL